MNVQELRELIPRLRSDVLAMIHHAGYGFTGSALSCLDIIASVYFGEINGRRVLQYDYSRPGWEDRDYFILSKWHGCPALYVCLAEAGFFPRDELRYFSQNNALLSVHPVIKIPGVEHTIAGFGQGLSVANGFAIALKADRRDNRIYVLMDACELQSGQVFEAMQTAAHYRLDSITVFVDYNRLQLGGTMRSVKNIEPLVEKFESCGWQAWTIADGHDVDQILDGLSRAWKIQRRPTVFICHTVSAHGVPFAENKAFYYDAVLSDEELRAVPG